MTGGEAFEEAFKIARAQAATDGAFDEILLRHWFQTAWEMCAAMIGLEYPAGTVTDKVEVDSLGTVRLSRRPSGPVKLYSCGQPVATVPPTSILLAANRPNLPNPYTGFGEGRGDWLLTCGTSLCCYCDLTAVYPVGDSDPCSAMPASFIQAVARLFSYMCENRGEVEMDESVFSKSGAKAFLSAQITYLM